jgi:hypothetical protein
MDKVRRIATIKQISAPDRHHRLSLAIIGFLVHLALVLQGAFHAPSWGGPFRDQG